MKGLSLWQPWASAVALGSKRIETRHWSTDYRGPVAIHATKRKVIGELIHLGAFWNWQGALWGMRSLREPDSQGNQNESWLDLTTELPFGAIIATAMLTDCRPTDSFTIGELDARRQPNGERGHLYHWTERQMGNFEIGRFGFVLEDVRRLPEPKPFVGRQSKFLDVPDSLLEIGR